MLKIQKRCKKALDDITYTESLLEADFCYHLEFEPKIIQYQATPYLLITSLRGYSYIFPDFEVFYDDGTISYIEIKYVADIARIEDLPQW